MLYMGHWTLPHNSQCHCFAPLQCPKASSIAKSLQYSLKPFSTMYSCCFEYSSQNVDAKVLLPLTKQEPQRKSTSS